jgi:hypothetical protein
MSEKIEDKDSSPGNESPDMTPQQTGQPTDDQAEGSDGPNEGHQGQSSDAPVTG